MNKLNSFDVRVRSGGEVAGPDIEETAGVESADEFLLPGSKLCRMDAGWAAGNTHPV